MRFIPTTPAVVEALKKKAKKLQRNGAGKHTDLLDRVARGAGYDHWHHVTLCLRETTSVHAERGLVPEVEAAVAAALEGRERLVITGPEASASQPFVLLSALGDAWMLDPETDRLVCLVWRGERQAFVVRDLPARVEIEWDGRFELAGPLFSVMSTNPAVGTRHIAGLPVERLREVLETHRSADRRMEQIFGDEEQLDLTPDLIADLVRLGWEEESVRAAARRGARYSPARDSLLFPPRGNL